MHGWQELAVQILVGVLVNVIIGVFSWLGKRQLIFFKRTMSFLPYPKKNARSLLGSRTNYQHWKLPTKKISRSLNNRCNLTAPLQRISYPTSFNQKDISQKKMFYMLGLNDRVNLVKLN
jgi:hypothetical protein